MTKKDIANHMSKPDLESSKLQARIDELNFHKFPAKLTPDDFEDFAKNDPDRSESRDKREPEDPYRYLRRSCNSLPRPPTHCVKRCYY